MAFNNHKTIIIITVTAIILMSDKDGGGMGAWTIERCG